MGADSAPQPVEVEEEVEEVEPVFDVEGIQATCAKCKELVKPFPCVWYSWYCSICENELDGAKPDGWAVYSCPSQETCRSLKKWGICRACSKVPIPEEPEPPAK